MPSVRIRSAASICPASSGRLSRRARSSPGTPEETNSRFPFCRSRGFRRSMNSGNCRWTMALVSTRKVQRAVCCSRFFCPRRWMSARYSRSSSVFSRVSSPSSVCIPLWPSRAGISSSRTLRVWAACRMVIISVFIFLPRFLFSVVCPSGWGSYGSQGRRACPGAALSASTVLSAGTRTFSGAEKIFSPPPYTGGRTCKGTPDVVHQ